MLRIRQTARKSVGGKIPRGPIAARDPEPPKEQPSVEPQEIFMRQIRGLETDVVKLNRQNMELAYEREAFVIKNRKLHRKLKKKTEEHPKYDQRSVKADKR